MGSLSFKTSAAAACLVAMLLTLGLHWHLLQSIAWARMLADYSRTGSWTEALEKTFDGEHPCPLCLQIKASRQQEERERQETPGSIGERFSPLFCEGSPTLVPSAPVYSRAAVPFVPLCHSYPAQTPPKPPPRQSAQV